MRIVKRKMYVVTSEELLTALGIDPSTCEIEEYVHIHWSVENKLQIHVVEK